MLDDVVSYIVLASYYIADHIIQQIDSLLAQSWPCIIYVFDDASTDGTSRLIQDKYQHVDNLILHDNSQRLGYVQNFEQGIKTVYNFVALSNQDDIWKPDKLLKTMSALQTYRSDQAILIYSDLEMIDEPGGLTHPSYLAYRAYAPRTAGTTNLLTIALGQNGVMGNTILMNRTLLEYCLPFPDDLHAHDYWISLIAQLYGQCHIVPEALVSYRIHEKSTSNSTTALASTRKNHTIPFWKKLHVRNYRLPYKVDSRGQSITKE